MAMKQTHNVVVFLISLFILGSCSSDSSKQAKSEEIQAVLENIDAVKDFENGSKVISNFQEKANAQADEVTNLRKTNISAFFEKAKYYEYCIVTVGEHTILKVSDFEDCQTSGSWATCLPLVEGYIRSNGWVYKKDYANQIIGTPDDQKRFAYLFNKLDK